MATLSMDAITYILLDEAACNYIRKDVHIRLGKSFVMEPRAK